jgi:hypothetical protein
MNKKIVNISKLPIKIVRCFYAGLNAEIEVPKDCQVYQSITSESLLILDVSRRDRVIGRTIGMIKDNEVVEEKHINAIELKIEGFRK